MNAKIIISVVLSVFIIGLSIYFLFVPGTDEEVYQEPIEKNIAIQKVLVGDVPKTIEEFEAFQPTKYIDNSGG